MNLFFFCNYIFERRKPTYLALKKSYSNNDLHTVDPVALGGFLIKKNYRQNYLSLQ